MEKALIEMVEAQMECREIIRDEIDAEIIEEILHGVPSKEALMDEFLTVAVWRGQQSFQGDENADLDETCCN